MILPLLVCLTALVAALAPLFDRRFGRAIGWPIAVILLGLGLWLATYDPAGTVEASAAWLPSIDVMLRFRLDGLSLLFSLLVLIIGAIVMAYSARYLGPGRHPSFFGLMTLFAAAMLGLVLADDVVLLWVFWEATTLCSFFLIARSGPAAREPAVRTLLVTVAGGLALLAAVVVMVVRTGSTQLSVILEHEAWSTDPVFAGWIAALVVLAACTKSAQFPFHAWLPDAMAAATPVSAYLHAAAMVKAGIYLVMRFSGVLGDNAVWNVSLITLGLLTAVIGAVFALQRHDLKELLAYSTVSQLGFLMATIGIGTSTALIAAVAHTVAHALFKSALFMLIGVVDTATGTRDLRELGGLRHAMPVTAAAVTVAAFSMAGVPPLLGFVTKEGMFTAMLDAPGPDWAGPVAAAVAVLAAIGTFAYSLRIVVGAFFGPVSEHVANHPFGRRPWPFVVPAALPAAVGVLLGPAVMLLDPLVTEAAADATGVHQPAHLALWHGVNTPLLMSIAVIATGALLVARRNRVDAALVDRRLWPGTGVGAVDALRRGSISLGARFGDLTRTDAPPLHLGIPAVVLTGLAVVGVLTLEVGDIVGSPTRATDWLLVALVALGVLGAVTARSRMAAVVVVGIVGFGVSLWFYALGAADVALTQLLVEVLTVVVMVLVLRRLPQVFHRVPRRRTVLAAVIAIGAGLAAGVATYALTGRREPSPASQYFLTEAEEQTGGTNVVNTILVDFRALDTLGELTVLGLAGVIIIGVLDSAGLLPDRRSPVVVTSTSPLDDAHDNGVFVRTLARGVGPLIVVFSLIVLYRGHNEPGGGFISALIGGGGFALAYLAAPTDSRARIRWPYVLLTGAGIALALVTGLAGFLDGSFLRPLHVEPFGIHLTTALLFDVGVYLAVIGVVLTALNRLGVVAEQPPDPVVEPEPDREGVS